MAREVDLAGIVERDRAYDTMGVDLTAPPATGRMQMAVDRRDLLTLLLETRNALQDVGECHGCLHHGNDEAEALLWRLSPLLPSADDVRGILA